MISCFTTNILFLGASFLFGERIEFQIIVGGIEFGEYGNNAGLKKPKK